MTFFDEFKGLCGFFQGKYLANSNLDGPAVHEVGQSLQGFSGDMGQLSNGRHSRLLSQFRARLSKHGHQRAAFSEHLEQFLHRVAADRVKHCIEVFQLFFERLLFIVNHLVCAEFLNVRPLVRVCRRRHVGADGLGYLDGHAEA